MRVGHRKLHWRKVVGHITVVGVVLVGLRGVGRSGLTSVGVHVGIWCGPLHARRRAQNVVDWWDGSRVPDGSSSPDAHGVGDAVGRSRAQRGRLVRQAGRNGGRRGLGFGFGAVTVTCPTATATCGGLRTTVAARSAGAPPTASAAISTSSDVASAPTVVSWRGAAVGGGTALLFFLILCFLLLAAFGTSVLKPYLKLRNQM